MSIICVKENYEDNVMIVVITEIAFEIGVIVARNTVIVRTSRVYGRIASSSMRPV